MSNGEAHVFRIRPEWVDIVFERKRYYTGLRAARGWGVGSTVILVSKTELGDSIVGYAVVGGVRRREEFTEEELGPHIREDWHTAVDFSDIVRLPYPVPIKETPLGAWAARGKFLHGRRIPPDELKEIMELITR